MHKPRILTILILLFVGVAVGCGDDDSFAAGEPCTETADCATGLLCVGQPGSQICDFP